MSNKAHDSACPYVFLLKLFLHDRLPGPTPNSVRTTANEVLAVPLGVGAARAGDALDAARQSGGRAFGLSKKRRAAGSSPRCLAPVAVIERLRTELASETRHWQFAKRQASAAARRETAHAEYVEDFTDAVRTCLAFHPRHAELAERLASRGRRARDTSGQRAPLPGRKRIPIEQRAEAALIAWLRHQRRVTTRWSSRVSKGNAAKSGACWLSVRKNCSRNTAATRHPTSTARCKLRWRRVILRNCSGASGDKCQRVSNRVRAIFFPSCRTRYT